MKQRKSFAWHTAIVAGSLLTQPESCSQGNTFCSGLLRSAIPLGGSAVRQWVKHLIISMIVSSSLCLLLASCGEAQEVLPPELPADTPVSVTADLRISMLPFTSLTEEGVTRVDATMSAAEKEIKSAYVVQFDGTSANSTAVWVSPDVSAQLKSGSPVTCNFTLSKGAKSRVYVIANPATAPTVDMTLQSLGETVPYTVSTSLPSTGLPMVACQDVDLDGVFELFQLKSALAKLTFKTSAGTLSLRGIPSAYSLVTPEPGEAAVRPSGVTYTNTVALTSGTAYYIPANLSGWVALSSEILRCSTFAPAGSMHVVISANSTTYTFYLGDGSASDFNVAANCAYTLNARITGTGGSFDMRIGTPPAITALDGSGTSNCYIATVANKWYSFNGKVMGNGKSTPLPGNMSSTSVTTAITPTALAPISTDVLWETWNTASTPVRGSVVQGVYLADGKIIFRSGTWQGNAVIAVRDAANNIIWSWHIWRTNTTPAAQTLANIVSTSGNFDATGTTTLSGLQIMDRNLGAMSATPQDNLSTGLHYQWGRKDPFPAYAGLTSPNNVVMVTQPAGIPIISGSSAQYTVAQSIQQPTTFFKSSNDWTSRNDNLWGTVWTNNMIIGGIYYNSNAGSKSIYDPCPVGWRVPPAYVFANATLSKGGTWNKGFSFSILTTGSSWFPAAGSRDYYGALNDIGTDGGYWVSSFGISYPTFGNYLYFNGSEVVPHRGLYRAYGLPARCVKE